MLDGDEVAVAEIAGRAVVARPAVVVGIQLDEAVAPLAQQRERQQAHLLRQLAFDVRDDRRPARIVHHHRLRSLRRAAGGARRTLSIALAKQLDLRAQRGDALVTARALAGGQVISEAKKDHREGAGNDEDGVDGATFGHSYSKFGS